MKEGFRERKGSMEYCGRELPEDNKGMPDKGNKLVNKRQIISNKAFVYRASLS